MTPSQKTALSFIAAQLEATGICPTLDDIANAMGVKSKSNAARVIDALVRDGYLKRGAYGTRRNLRLADINLRDVTTSALMAELERRGVALG
jgi:SOS-response transcriptional repressor LexA